MINGFFDLTKELTLKFVLENFCKENEAEHVFLDQSKTHVKYQIQNTKKDINSLYLIIDEITIKIITISLIFDEKKPLSIIVDWENNIFSNDKFSFPIEDDKINQILVKKFNQFFKNQISEKLDFFCQDVNDKIKSQTDLYISQEFLDDKNHLNNKFNGMKEFVEQKSGQHINTDKPRFEDELEINNQNIKSYSNNFFSYGDKDLYPSGIFKEPNMKPYLDPLNIENNQEDGMFASMNHPFFKNKHHLKNNMSPNVRYEHPYPHINDGFDDDDYKRFF